MMLGCKRYASMSPVTSTVAKCDSANTWYREVFAVLHLILKARQEKKDKPADILVKLWKLFVQDCKVPVPRHAAK